MKILASLIFIILPLLSVGQITKNQFFDGADTSSSNSLIIQLDSFSTWEIGPPNNLMFDSAATLPNAIVTDLDSSYPVLDTSRFSFGVSSNQFLWGIVAIQWKQKLDFESDSDGGIIEYSIDSGNTWSNVMNDPYVYSFYGFNTNNLDTLPNNTYAFSGTDSSWKDVWLCYDASWLSFQDSLSFRFTIVSDANDTQQEGWMIDNFINRFTIIHTLKSEKQEEYISLAPNPSNGSIQIETEKRNEKHYIQSIKLLDVRGQVLKEWGLSPTKFKIDIGEFPDGNYLLQINTNVKSETHQILLQH